jgi:hypothetical protein
VISRRRSSLAVFFVTAALSLLPWTAHTFALATAPALASELLLVALCLWLAQALPAPRVSDLQRTTATTTRKGALR